MESHTDDRRAPEQRFLAPDGSKLVFVSRHDSAVDGGFGLWVMSADGAVPELLRAPTDPEQNPDCPTRQPVR